jgi:hypothetical protein
MRTATDHSPPGAVVSFPARRPDCRDRPAFVPDPAPGEAWIYRPCRSVLQAGARAKPWVLDFIPAAPERPHFLTGWTGSGDTRKQIRLEFPSLREALLFATRRGWDATVVQAREPRRTPRRPTWLSGPPTLPQGGAASRSRGRLTGHDGGQLLRAS